MKILVYGSKGWIGSQFVKILESQHLEYICGKSRTDNNISLLAEIEECSPTHIVSFIGRTHGTIGEKKYTTIDYLEQDGKLLENVRDNLYSPLLLANICKDKDIHYTYLGTGCIFKFDENHPFGLEENGFRESDLPNFFGSSYSIVKGFTDRLMSLYNNVLNLRIRMPITNDYNPRNFITKITQYEYICSIPNSMTVLPELLPYVLDMMKKKVTGNMNLTNPGLISHNEILEMYKEIVDPTFQWKNFSMEAQRKILASDRSNNFLDTTKLETMYPAISNIKDSIKQILVEYKENLKIHCSTKKPKYNLLITGGCGFIGSNFINYYFHKNKINKLVNIDAMYYCANEENVDESIRNDNKYIFIKGNICNDELITNILKQHNITHIIHFAAQSHVQNSFDDSISFTNDNIVGTHTLLECCKKYGKLEKFIHVSTDEVYGESMLSIEETHKTEHSILCPTNPYAATKAGAELLAQSYNHSFNLPIIITRGNNVYGPNQYPEKLIPRFIKLLKENKKVTIHGDGSNVRGFLHAYDTASAFETILEKGVIGEIYNIGCNDGMEYSVIDIAKTLIQFIKKTDKYYEWIEYVKDRPFNDKRYYISNQKLKDLGWEIKKEFFENLRILTK
jgi:dTDP-glucose 4,6-dehydratase